MALARYAIILACGVFSVEITFGQEHLPVNADPTNPQTLEMLTERAKMFEAKAQLATQCAKGIRLIQKVVNLTSPNEDSEEEEWIRETFLLVRLWFTKEQQDEWYFAGKEFAFLVTDIDQAHTKEEAMETYKKGFSLIMNAQVAALERLSDDLESRQKALAY